MTDILEFRMEHLYLSNFYPAKTWYEGDEYPTAEHAYQAAKTQDLKLREKIRMAQWAPRAKAIGATARLPKDWDTKRLVVMHRVVWQKFSNPDNKRIRDKLIATGNCHIEEGNYWGDTYWGVCRGKGSNHLGTILMDVRGGL